MKIKSDLTYSKILAFVIIVVGSAYSFMYNDSATLIATFSAATTVIGIKTIMDRNKNKNENEYE